MIGRLSQRKAVQRLSGPGGAASAALFAALGYGPAGELAAGRVGADGGGAPFSGFSISTAGVTVPARPPLQTSISPDGNWIIRHWGNTDASPAFQIYKRTGPKSWAYHSAITGIGNLGGMTEDVANAAFRFSANSKKLVIAGTNSNKLTPYILDLVSDAWVLRTGSTGLEYSNSYAESDSGLFTVQPVQSNNGGIVWSLNGSALKTVLHSYSSSGLSGVRIYISPLGTSVVLAGVSGGSSQIARYLWNGTDFVFQGMSNPSFAGNCPSSAAWISEDVLAFGMRRANVNLTNGASTPTHFFIILQVSTGTFSSMVLDNAIYVNTQTNAAQFDCVADVIAAAPGVLGYVTQFGVVGTMNYTGTTLTSIGPAVALRQPKMTLGASLIRSL